MSKNPLIGFLEYIDLQELRGWVFDPQKENDPVTVDIFYQDVPRAKVIADEYRVDLAEAGIGNGKHAFTWRVPPGEFDLTLGGFSARLGDWILPYSEDATMRLQIDRIDADAAQRRNAPIAALVEPELVSEKPPAPALPTPSPLSEAVERPKNIRLAIEESGLIDHAYVVGQITDSAKRAAFRKDPVESLLTDTDLSLKPHPLFDQKWYAETYRQSISPGEHPLAHYVESGIAEGLMPNPGFLPSWYLGFVSAAEMSVAARNPLLHYIKTGSKSGASPHPLFQPSWYFEKHADVKRAGREPLAHYLNSGVREKRHTHPLIDPEFYAKSSGSESSPLDHYWKIGIRKGLSPHPLLEVGGRSSTARKPSFSPPKALSQLDSWIRVNRRSNRRSLAISKGLRDAPIKPRLSIIIPVYNPPVNIFRDVIRRVLEQSYSNFEVIIVDDKSTNPLIRQEIEYLSSVDSRVTALFHERNTHISTATNDGVDISSGDYIVFLDHDDVLMPEALAYLAIYISMNNNPAVLYSDDCRTDLSGENITAARFKPQWSPELLLSYSYASHLRAVRADIYKQIGGSRVGYEGSQDHDMFLRISELNEKIVHIPFVLYGRRAVPGSTALSGDEKSYSYEAGEKAVKGAFLCRGLDIDVVRPDWAIRQGLGIYKPVMPLEGPSVSIIIPTRNNAETLIRLVRSLSLTRYKNFDVLVVDNDSDDPETLEYLAKCPFRVIRISNDANGFSYARINNLASSEVTGDFILFLNDDTEVLTPEWLSQMVGWGRLPGVGAVGARLLFANRRVQHGGVSPEQSVGYTMFRGLPGADHGYLSSAVVTRNCAAVTAACMLTPRQLFKDLGGFDEKNFAVAFNDVDYCLRLGAKGLRTVYCAEAELFHHEGTSRPKVDKPIEVANFKRIYGSYLDPYLNPNLDRRSNNMAIAAVVANLPCDQRRPKVLFCSHNLNHEGAPNSLMEIVAGLLKSGSIDADVIAPAPGPLADIYKSLGVNVIYSRSISNVIRAKTYEEYMSLCLELGNAIDIGNYDVVFANTAELHPIIHCAYNSGIPSIWCIREGEPWSEYYSKLSDGAETAALEAYSLPYKVVFVSNASFRNWAALNTVGNFQLITNGLDVERFMARCSGVDRLEERRKLGFSTDDVVILALGGLIARKGQHDLLFSISLLSTVVQRKIQILVVGARNNAYSERLARMIDGFPRWLKERITIVPESRSVGQYYMAADIFFCGSRVESYPRIILEAECIGLPIITTPVSGIPEQVYNGVNAEFYEPGKIEQLAGIIERLVLNSERRNEMGKQSRIVFDGLTSYQTMLDRYKEVIYGAAVSSASLDPVR